MPWMTRGLAFVLGFYWLFHGITELFVAVGHADLPGRAWMIVSGILSVVVGVVVVVAPGISLVALTLVLGVWLIVFGVIAVVRAVQIRSLVHARGSGPVAA